MTSRPQSDTETDLLPAARDPRTISRTLALVAEYLLAGLIVNISEYCIPAIILQDDVQRDCRFWEVRLWKTNFHHLPSSSIIFHHPTLRRWLVLPKFSPWPDHPRLPRALCRQGFSYVTLDGRCRRNLAKVRLSWDGIGFWHFSHPTLFGSKPV
jgi:hypothetical protein